MLTGDNNLGVRLAQAAGRSRQQWYADVHSRRFIEHNRRVWGRPPGERAAEVLFNFDRLQINQVRFSYVMNTLAAQHGASIKAYTSQPISGLSRMGRVYRSFNVDGYVLTQLDPGQSRRVEEIYQELRPGLTSKQEISDAHVLGVWVGVDVYDTYLRETRLPTLDLGDGRWEEVWRRGIGLVVFWQDYLQQHDVRAVSISYDNYLDVKVIAKVAHAAGIPVYNPDISAPIVRGEHSAAYAACIDFPQRFQRLPPDLQELGLAKAKASLNIRLGGKVGVGILPNQQPGWHHDYNKQELLPDNGRPKVLICSHEFADAPHDYGETLFVDFYEWMVWLGELTGKTNYDWYIKLHPGHWPGSAEAVNDLASRYPQFQILEATTSNHQLVESGIGVVLTCGGTVGQEFPLFGVPVINAGFNKHIAYDFNYHPETIEEYKRLLLDLPGLKRPSKPRQVYEYYFMYHFAELLDDQGVGWWDQLNVSVPGVEKAQPVFYSRFLDQLTAERHDQAVAHLKRVLPLRLQHLSEALFC